MSQFVTIELIPTTPDKAAKSCDANGVNSWSVGKNQLDWTAPPPITLGVNFRTAENRFMYLQYSAIDNNRPKPSGPSFYHTVLGRTTPEPDSFWTTLRTWGNSELPTVGAWPTTYQHLNVPHSTLYYYRLIFIVLRENDTPWELDSNVAVVVQPFDLSVCSTDACPPVAQANCTTRLVWDAPILYVPFISITHVPQTECGPSTGCYKVTVAWPYTPTPTDFTVYKSTDSGVTFNAVSTPFVYNPVALSWYDSDSAHRRDYYLVANRPNGSTIKSNIVTGTY